MYGAWPTLTEEVLQPVDETRGENAAEAAQHHCATRVKPTTSPSAGVQHVDARAPNAARVMAFRGVLTCNARARHIGCVRESGERAAG